MFSGLVEELGQVVSLTTASGGREFGIRAPRLSSLLSKRDSVAVNGVCLTVTRKRASVFTVNAIEETLSKTTLGSIGIGMKVNLEAALLPTTRLGGHIVQGHVDCRGTIKSIKKLEGSHEIVVSIPGRFSKLILPTGSICLDGISLTVARCGVSTFTVAIIPFTWDNTTIRYCIVGDKVNIEFDIIGKYIQRLSGR
jgi:riboflavin synthase